MKGGYSSGWVGGFGGSNAPKSNSHSNTPLRGETQESGGGSSSLESYLEQLLPGTVSLERHFDMSMSINAFIGKAGPFTGRQYEKKLIDEKP